MSDNKINSIIYCNNIQKIYSNVTALDKITYSIQKGEIFCLLGPNGSGKTTTIKLMIGHIKPDSGKIRIMNMDPIKDRSKILPKIGLVPQEIALYMELTARENLRFHGHLFNMPKDKLEKRIDEMLEISGLKSRENDQVRTYSGGMQRRLQLVRALLHDPDIILLDEPTLGIDVQSRNAINEYILKIAKLGKTIIVTTNYLEEAEKLANRIVILDNKIVAGPDTLENIRGKFFPESIFIFESLTEKLTADFDEKIEKVTHSKIVLKREVGNFTRYNLKSENDVQRTLENLLELSKVQNIPIIGLTVKKATLEDIFLKLTGRQYRDKS